MWRGSGGRGSPGLPRACARATPRPAPARGTAARVLRARPGAVVLRPAGRGGRGSRTRGGPDYSRTRVSRLFSTSLRARPARAPRAAGPRPTSSRRDVPARARPPCRRTSSRSCRGNVFILGGRRGYTQHRAWAWQAMTPCRIDMSDPDFGTMLGGLRSISYSLSYIIS